MEVEKTLETTIPYRECILKSRGETLDSILSCNGRVSKLNKIQQ